MAFDQNRIDEIPRLPGVYLMKDRQGRVIYVGKAKELRSRVRSYFRQQGDGRHAIRFLMQRLHDLEVVVTNSEKEALILENTLIKKHRPRYNVAFRDDKSFFHIRIDPTHPYPRLGLVRRPKRDGAMYFGPYASAHSVRRTLRLLQWHMGIRTCKDSQLRLSRRTCLNYQMGRCAGVCRGDVTAEQYGVKVQEAVLFLQGRSGQLLAHLEGRMRDAAAGLRFEEAARIRDQIQATQRTTEVQRTVTPFGPDRDVIGLFRGKEDGILLVLRVRDGKVWESLPVSIRPTPLEDREVLMSFLKQFYETTSSIPPEILVPIQLSDEARLLENWMGGLAGRKIRIRTPQRGEAKDQLEMARQNARWAYKGGDDTRGILENTAHALHLRGAPRVIEGFDISTLGGKEAVGSAVRFEDGSPQKGAYRQYHIRTVAGMDDYAMMYELLSRHLETRKKEADLPDLLVLDGGKGQLGVAQAVKKDLSLEQIEAVALAKARGTKREGQGGQDRVFIPGSKDAKRLSREPGVLRLLQQIRDEAHRFAVTHHRKRRGRERMVSSLDGIPGVGPARKRSLLKAFGSLKRVKEASVEELARAPGISQQLARLIYDALRGGSI